MPLPPDFCAFILTHGRPDRVVTIDTLRRHGYTGRIVLVVDDEDKTRDEYVRRFGDSVVIFSKREAEKITDACDNFDGRRGVVYARNACFDIAASLGVGHFWQLDDDYRDFSFRIASNGDRVAQRIRDLDAVLGVMFDYFRSIPALSIAMTQTGDWIGGGMCSTWRRGIKPTRKVMNTFLCSVDRRFSFFGRVNEDVNMYATLGMRGALFLTIPHLCLMQTTTQANPGGLTELYLDRGTYVKSFYTVMAVPSACTITEMNSRHPRLHHEIAWRKCAPMIVDPKWRKARAQEA